MALVVVGGLLAASTGIVCATVSAMGIIALPTMLRRGYQKELVAGTICASGTLGQIIPPSIILIILADIMNLSVGELFAGSLLPGGVLIFLYLAYVGIISMVRPQYAPRIPAEELATLRRKGLFLRFLKSLFPPAFLILTVLGSIFFGIASPTEAAAMGAAGALFLGLIKKRLTYETMRYVVITTTKINCMVFIILVSATCFGLVFRGVGGDHLVRDFLLGVAGHVGHGGVLAVVMGTVFFLGFFLDYIEISFIVVPILSPIITEMGFNPLWFAVLFGVNFQTSFMTPPFGFSLF